jgi:hypothetical protein
MYIYIPIGVIVAGIIGYIVWTLWQEYDPWQRRKLIDGLDDKRERIAPLIRRLAYECDGVWNDALLEDDEFLARHPEFAAIASPASLSLPYAPTAPASKGLGAASRLIVACDTP